MAMLAVSIVTGVLLGIYCRALAVIPGLIVVVIATAVVDAGASLLLIFVHIIVVCATLEFCYLVGVISPSVIRHLIRSAADGDGANAIHSNHPNGPFALSN